MEFETHQDEALAPFFDDGWLSEVLYRVKSGKEATIFCCRSGARAPCQLIAAKIYAPLELRGFRNDAAYIGGRVHMARPGRASRAVEAGSAFGRRVQAGTWLEQEWDVLNRLSDAGAGVPIPYARGERCLLMEYIGTETAPAPMLHALRPDRATAGRYIDDLLEHVEMMLDLDLVHGDLSPYNVMVQDDEPVLIDFPQAIDPRLNRNGRTFLMRDIERLCDWAARCGVNRPAHRIGTRLWRRFTLGELG